MGFNSFGRGRATAHVDLVAYSTNNKRDLLCIFDRIFRVCSNERVSGIEFAIEQAIEEEIERGLEESLLEN